MLIVLLIFHMLVHCTHGLSTIFGGVHEEYLHKIVRNTKSAEMLNYLNVLSDPCTNFYDFACGHYKRINPPNDFIKNSVFQDLTEGMHRKFLSLLRPDEATDTQAEMKVKNFYESCMNLAILRTTYGVKLREIINEFGHMPALEGDHWRDINNFDWMKTVAEINRKYGKKIIVGCIVVPDLANKKVNTLHVVAQAMPLGTRSFYSDEAHEDARNNRKMNIVYNLKHIFGLRTSIAEKTAEEIFQFETHLFVGYKEREIDGYQTLNFDNSADYKVLTIEEMQTKYDSHIDVKRLINLTFGYLPNKNVSDLLESSAEKIINAVNITPDRIVANYIFYNLIENFMLVRDPDARNLENFMILARPKWKPQLQKVCISKTEEYFAQILTNMVYRRYISNETELQLRPLWETTKWALRDILDSSSLPRMTGIYQTAVDKLQAMKLRISSNEEINFVEKYDDLTMNKHDYVENVKSILIFEAVNARATLNKSSTTFAMDGMLSPAPAYNSLENIITVPVSLLQPYYLWSDSYPNALKYGTVGFLIARQLIHVFGEHFIILDKSAKLVGMDEDSANYFSNIKRCFNDQYHTYYLDGGLSLPKLKSQFENIADTGGVRLAHKAYMRWYTQSPQQRNSTDEHFPHLNYTSQQLFFISFGQMLCSTDNNLTKRNNNFAVETYRVNQALSNLDDFSKTFKCSDSSKMNPLTKCKIY